MGTPRGYEKIMRIKADIDQLEVSDYLDELAANVEGLYYSFYVLDGMETTLNGQIDMMEVLFRITEENYQKGFIELGDFLTVSGNQLELKEAKAEILFQKEKVLFMLQELIADPTFTPERLDFNGIDLDMNLFPVPSVSEAVARGLSGNQQLEQLVKAAYIKEQELALARKSGIFRPDLALQVGFSYNGSRVPLLEKDWLRQDDFDLNITLAGTTSLWDSGLSATEKRIKKAELEAFQVQQEQARQKIHMQITQTISGLEFSRSKIETLEVRRQLISEETELAGNRYEQGDISEAEYVKQQIQLNQHELKIFSEWQNFLNGYSQLGYLLGN